MEQSLEQLDHNFAENKAIADQIGWVVAYPDVLRALGRLQEAWELDSYYGVVLNLIFQADGKLATANAQFQS